MKRKIGQEELLSKQIFFSTKSAYRRKFFFALKLHYTILISLT